MNSEWLTQGPSPINESYDNTDLLMPNFHIMIKGKIALRVTKNQGSFWVLQNMKIVISIKL